MSEIGQAVSPFVDVQSFGKAAALAGLSASAHADHFGASRHAVAAPPSKSALPPIEYRDADKA